MIVQFFRYGNGLSKGPLDYLLGKDRDRDYAKVLQGDVSEVSGLIDTSPYAKKYTSGCLSFYEHDLSDQDKQKIMQDFEQALFPGMDQSQYRVLWIEHQDKLNEETGERRLELNFLIPNVEILTGQRLQPYYDKADRSRIDLFKKITNYEYQLHDADDPLYRQAVTTAKNLPKTVNEIKETLDIEATRAVESGLITDRQSMKKWLLDLGLEVTRETKKSLSIKNPNDDEKARPIRLTGAIYEQDFRLTEKSQQLTIAASERYRREAEQRNQSDFQRYAEYSAKRSTELERQYRQRETEHTRLPERSDSRDFEAAFDSGSQNRAATSRNSIPDHAREERTDSPNFEAAERSHSRDITRAEQTQSKLEQVQRLEPRNSRPDQAEKSTFHIEYSPDFSSLYSSYQQYLFGVRQQEQIQRYQSNGSESDLSQAERRESEYSEVWQREKIEIVRTIRPDSPSVRQQLRSSAGDELNELRSQVIADYRAATRTAQTAAEAARDRITSIRSTSQDDCAVRDLQQYVSAVQQDIEREKYSVRTDHPEAKESSTFREIINRLGERVKAAIRDPFDTVSEWAKHREPSETSFGSKFTPFSTERNRETDSTVDRANQKEIGLSTAVSRTIRGFNTEGLFTALDELDRRKKIEQVRRNDRDNMPSPW